MSMESKLKELEMAVSKKEGHKNPDYYKTLKEYRMLQIIQCLTNGVEIPAEVQKWYSSYLNGNKYVIEVHEGDNIMQLMQKHEKVTDVYHKLMKAAEEAGLTANFAKGIFVKK